jgi:hypothetical protein
LNDRLKESRLTGIDPQRRIGERKKKKGVEETHRKTLGGGETQTLARKFSFWETRQKAP